MLRGEGVICGTTTTGTGTLTLAACPEPPGGLDFYVWLTTSGMGFVNGNAVLVPYVIIEYTDSTFAEESKRECGIGTVTLGASLGATTLARTTVQMTTTSLNTAPAVPLYGGAASAVSIGTAANTLVMIAPSAKDIFMASPYFETTLTFTTNMGVPSTPGGAGVSTVGMNADGTGIDHYLPIILLKPMLVKRATIEVLTAYATGSPVSTAFFRIYAVGTNGRPGKLLLDLGTFGTNPLNALGAIQTAAHATGLFLPPGEYIGNVFLTFTGGSTNPSIGFISNGINFGTFGSVATHISVSNHMIATGGSSTAPDPANVTGYARGSTSSAALLAYLSPT